ncbi:ATP-binding protein [Kitasatospora sp. NBC_01250]|uniref:ATP-binding protein n=1 Tax=unclassified Kitasatospora TaxID=2633591 RepID=UPI002E106D3D|nr:MULTISPECIES: ATP-binding protein [unclassified Kitasatospora]WSJ71237.1 ATP-binding protein [Kitasatospora sp. NBC_01302]
MSSPRTTWSLGSVPDLTPIPTPDQSSNVLRCDLPVTNEAGQAAREQLKRHFATWLTETGRDNAELVLTELIANAVAASIGAEAILLTARVTAGQLLIEVFDESPGVPCPRLTDDFAEDARGLLLVDALSTAWGWHPAPGGKVVWALPKAGAA